MKMATRWLSWLAAIVPAWIVFRLILVALYASPESDDFCFAYHYNADGVLKTVAFFYNSVIGRVVPMVLMMLPAAISQVLRIDFFVIYPLILISNILAFVAVAIFVAGKLWPTASNALRVLAGLAMSATFFVEAVSIREMLYWSPGTYSYLFPAAIMMIMMIELFASIVDQRPLSSPPLLALLCFLGAMCNEFTPLWLIGLIGCSYLFRRISWHPCPLGGVHAVLTLSTMIGFAVVLAAPGNVTRMGAYPAGGHLGESIWMGLHFATMDWNWLFAEPALWGWLAFAAIFSAFVAPSGLKSTRQAPSLIVGLAAFLFGVSFVGCFVGYFATGEDLAMRARNEMMVVMITGMTCVVVLIVHWINPTRFIRAQFVTPVAIIACALLCTFPIHGRAMNVIVAEYPQFDRFWLETMNRNAAIKLTPEADVVVPDRTVKPTVLMSADLTDNPNRLPNDCVAAFYGKRSVVMRP